MLFGGIPLGRVGAGEKTHAVEWRRGECWPQCNSWGRAPADSRVDPEQPERWPQMHGSLADVTCRRCIARLTYATTASEVDLAIGLAKLATLGAHGPSGDAVMQLAETLAYAAGERAKVGD